jgi:hypothetical protein
VPRRLWASLILRRTSCVFNFFRPPPVPDGRSADAPMMADRLLGFASGRFQQTAAHDEEARAAPEASHRPRDRGVGEFLDLHFAADGAADPATDLVHLPRAAVSRSASFIGGSSRWTQERSSHYLGMKHRSGNLITAVTPETWPGECLLLTWGVLSSFGLPTKRVRQAHQRPRIGLNSERPKRRQPIPGTRGTRHI